MGQHERGHALQYWQDYAFRYPLGSGWCAWWIEIGVPSAFSAATSDAETHSEKWFEEDATNRGTSTKPDAPPGAK
jgi:hypothetical protein